MQFRRFGTSDLVVSEVGIGTWTLASDWWGVVAEPMTLLHAALECGINFIDTAPVYGDDAIGETMLAELIRGRRSEIVLTTKCGYDLDLPRIKGQGERPQDFSPAGVRAQLDDSLRRMQTDYIDLYQLHNARIDPVRSDDLWEALLTLRGEGKIRELGVALGPAIGWKTEGIESIDDRPIVALQTVFNILEQEPGLSFAARPRVQDGACGLIARVPHASDTLSDKVTPDTVFPPGDHRAHRNKDNMLDNFEKAETLAFLWSPETGRTKGQAAIAGILANPLFTTVLPTVVTVDEVREYAAASDMALTTTEADEVAKRFARNFDHVDRYVMPLKTSVA